MKKLSVRFPTRTGVIVLKIEPARTGINVPLQPGDIILSVNDAPIMTTAQLETLMKKPLRAWQIVYLRGEQKLTLTVRM